MRARHAAAVVLTAHHADDQAETVLFRALRGTGVRGLRGIAPRSRLRIRPLLPFWREELEAYAEAVGLSWRDDSTNVALDRARNVLRHVVLPRCEADVAPGARRALVRLARHAAADQEAWEAVERTLLAGVLEEASPDRIRLARAALLAYDPAVRALLLRACARRLGVDLPEAGTRVAMEFTSRGGSGRMIRLPGRLVLARSFERLELARGSGEPAVTHAYEALRVEDPSAGTGEAIVGGRRLRVHWGPRGARGPLTEGFDPGALRFPLRLRGWRPGDRMRLRYGTKKVAKLMAEARVPLEERHRVAVLADGDGRALWVPGVARSADAVPVPGHGEFYIGVEDADSS
jgi:tRNA(Ile)-lysidine synthase